MLSCKIFASTLLIAVIFSGNVAAYDLPKIKIEKMKDRFLSNPNDLVCTIGPAICQMCYEVSCDLYNDFVNKFGESKAFISQNGSYYIDLALVNKQILLSCGVSEDNIFLSDLCTCCNTDILYSHRGQGSKRGIFASFLQIV